MCCRCFLIGCQAGRRGSLVRRGVARYSAALHNCPSRLTLMQDDDQRLRKLDCYLCPALCRTEASCVRLPRRQAAVVHFLLSDPISCTYTRPHSDSVLVLLLSCSWGSHAPLSSSLTQLDSGRWTEEVNEVIPASAAPAIFFKYV